MFEKISKIERSLAELIKRKRKPKLMKLEINEKILYTKETQKNHKGIFKKPIPH